MKRVFTLLFGLICVISLVSCAEKTPNPLSVIEDTSMILLSYTAEDEEREITFSDSQTVAHICENLKSLTLEPLKNSPENKTVYNLVFYGETTKDELILVDIIDNHTVALEGNSYQVTEGELDIAYLEEAIETMEYVLSTTN